MGKRSASLSLFTESSNLQEQSVANNNRTTLEYLYSIEDLNPTSTERSGSIESSIRKRDEFSSQMLEIKEESATYAQIDKLSKLINELRKENKALTLKNNSTEALQKRIKELEAQNKRLSKPNSISTSVTREKTTSPIKSVSKATTPVKSRSSVLQQEDLLVANQYLTQEVFKLKNELEALRKDNKKAPPPKKVSSQDELEMSLHDANIQIEFLNNELVSKDFEVQELREQILKLDASPQRQNNDYAKITNILKQQREEIQSSVAQKIKSKSQSQVFSDVGEYQLDSPQHGHPDDEVIITEPNSLKLSMHEKDLEIEKLKKELDDVKKQTSEEIKAKEIELEKSIRGKSNDAIKQMLQEKKQYQDIILQLGQRIDVLEEQNTKITLDYEKKLQQIDDEELKGRPLGAQINKLRSWKKDIQKSEGGSKEESPVETEKNLELNIKNQLEHNNEKALLERHIHSLSTEVNELENKLSYYANELTEVKNHAESFEANFEVQKEKLLQNVKTLQEEKEKYQKTAEKEETVKNNLVQENNFLKLKLKETEGQIENLELEIHKLKKANEDQRHAHSVKLSDLEADKRQVQNIANDCLAQQDELLSEMAELKTINLDLRETTVKQDSEKKKREGELKYLQTVLEANKDELEMLYGVLKERKHECETTKKLLQQLQKEYDDFKQRQNSPLSRSKVNTPGFGSSKIHEPPKIEFTLPTKNK